MTWRIKQREVEVIEGSDSWTKVKFDIWWDGTIPPDTDLVSILLGIKHVTTNASDQIGFVGSTVENASMAFWPQTDAGLKGSFEVFFLADDMPEDDELFEITVTDSVFWERDPKTGEIFRYDNDAPSSDVAQVWIVDDDTPPASPLTMDGLLDPPILAKSGLEDDRQHREEAEASEPLIEGLGLAPGSALGEDASAPLDAPLSMVECKTGNVADTFDFRKTDNAANPDADVVIEPHLFDQSSFTPAAERLFDPVSHMPSDPGMLHATDDFLG